MAEFPASARICDNCGQPNHLKDMRSHIAVHQYKRDPRQNENR